MQRSLQDKVSELISAGFSGIWVQTYDVNTAQSEIASMARDFEWDIYTWDCEEGFAVWDPASNAFELPKGTKASLTGGQDEIVTQRVRELPDALKLFAAHTRRIDQVNEGPVTAVLLVKNPHLYPPQHMGRVLQIMENEAVSGRAERRHVICLTTQGEIFKEVEKQYMLVNHPLPDREQLLASLTAIQLDEEQRPTPEELPHVLDACMGLTDVEAANAGALSVVHTDRIIPEEVWEVKAQILKKAKGLSLWRGQESFSKLGGLNNLKEFCRTSIENSRPDDPRLQAKGVLLLGVPGSGKSAFAKALGHETRRPTIRLDIGSLMGQFVGQTEGNTRDAIQVIDAMAPAILMVDEVEKALAAGQQAHEVSTRMMGTWLSWLQDHESDIFTICTCNDIHRIIGPHPEFARTGRFDGVFFVDLPTKQEKQVIWDIYLKQYNAYGLDSEQDLPADEDWTGAEIEGCCKLAALHQITLKRAARNILPVATTSDTVKSLREWATARCLSALHSGQYKGPAHQATRANKMAIGNGKTRRISKQRSAEPSDS